MRSSTALTMLFAFAAFSCKALDPDRRPPPGPPCTTGPDPAPLRDSCTFSADTNARDTVACIQEAREIPIQHIIVLMQENRSFDHYLGHLTDYGVRDVDVADPSASNPLPQGATVDASGSSTDTTGSAPGVVTWHHANPCFDDPNHSWQGSHQAWDQGRNDGFVIASSGAADAEGNDPTGSRAMSYYDASDLPFYYQLASTFSISDRYFADVLGPTLPNRLYLYQGSSFGLVAGNLDTGLRQTIFHELEENGIAWKVYASDVAAAFSTISFALDAVGRVSGIDDFIQDARNNQLPEVAFVDPHFFSNKVDEDSEAPPAVPSIGQHFVYQIVSALMASPAWTTSTMFITYDENGGLFDHVPPPSACPPDGILPNDASDLGGFDRYGFRVPLFVVSPYARAGYVSHVTHSHASILKFIEAKFGLGALSARDANADAMLDMFDFDHPPFLTPPSLTEPPVDSNQVAACEAQYGK